MYLFKSRYRASNAQWVHFDQFEADYRDAVKPTHQKGPDSLKYDVVELVETYCGMEGCYAVPGYKTKEGRWVQFVFSFDADDDGGPIIQYSHCYPSS
ncbi:MAG: hypothetical protein FWD99_10245 [Oscillospiraceae bacterium]|nr:hypothetical protein [Oscillospiraceae bacterium]